MKKIITTFIIAFILISAGCNNAQKAEPAQDDLEFSKKVECGKLLTSVQEQAVRDFNQEDFEISRVSSVSKIFYSPLKNSCLYVLRLTVFNKPQNFGTQMLDLRDALTNELLETEAGTLTPRSDVKRWDQAQLDFNAKIGKYE